MPVMLSRTSRLLHRWRRCAWATLVLAVSVGAYPEGVDQSASEPASNTNTGDVTLGVTVTGIRDNRGTVMLQVLASQAALHGDAEPAFQASTPVANGQALVEAALPPGEYAVRLFHDLNDNGKLDTSFFGMPKEPWGTSNDAPARFGPPKWRDMRFELGPSNHRITVKLRH